MSSNKKKPPTRAEQTAALATLNVKMVPAEPGEGVMAAVGSVARRLGYAGQTMGEMMQTWLKDIVTTGDNGTTLSGTALAKAAVNYLGMMLTGVRSAEAVEKSGLTWSALIMMMDSSKDFQKVVQDVYRIRRQMQVLQKASMGEAILDTAFELATEGEEQHHREDGHSLGWKKKSEKMLDRLLTLAGKEFSRDAQKPEEKGASGRPSVALTFNFGGGREQSMGVMDVVEQQ